MPQTTMRDDLWDESVAGHKARQADQLAATALEIVADEGMSALTMSAIAAKAGVARQTLYRYFPDIESVLTHAISIVSTLEPLTNVVASAGSPVEQIEAFVRLALEAAAAGHPSTGQFEQTLPPQARAAARDHREQVERMVIDIVDQGVSDGSFSTELDPEIDGAILYRYVISAHDLAAETKDVSDLSSHVIESVHRLLGSATRDG